MMSFIVFKTNYGWIAISSTSRGIRFLTLPEPDNILAKQKIINALYIKYGEKIINTNQYLSNSEALYFLNKARDELSNYFDGKKVSFTVPVDLEGYIQFQKDVWEAVRKVPYGNVCSYRHIAKYIGKPTASRAVGQVLKKNPVPIIIPCHRVISSDGNIGGFSGGIQLKKMLLTLEGLVIS
ncbi:MAG: methylated-DNA--[protein]-cysteine S-methyltransferase [bacterium]